MAPKNNQQTSPGQKNLQSSPSVSGNNQNNLWLIILSVILVTALVAGGGVSWWLTTKTAQTKLKQELSGLQAQVTALQQPGATSVLSTPVPTTTTAPPAPPPTTSPAVPTIDPYTGWKTHTNETFGYTVKHPGNTRIVGNDLNKTVVFEGPLVDNERWPILSISHLESAFYQPPSGSNLKDWVTSQVPHDEVGNEIRVAGLPTIHLVTNRSPQAYAQDDYYFIKNNQLYHINLLHSANKKDWGLYNKFLQSFTFTK